MKYKIQTPNVIMEALHGKILVERSSLNLKMMLMGGQCFRWKEVSDNQWIGTVGRTVWSLCQFDEHIEYEVKGSLYEGTNAVLQKSLREHFLRDYLRLDAPLSKYYQEWSKRDANFKQVAEKCYGIRILKQEPVENVFSFICSSNNNIKRISGLVEKLCKMYGTKICEVDGTAYFAFPQLSELVKSEESDLRKAGFGYRAKFIHNAAQQMETFGGMEWLEGLKSLPYTEAKNELMRLTGIGAKVADCICLMSLGHMEALPVDTHVYQIACHSYLPHLKKVKNMTDKIYNEIGDFFRTLYGPLAGWAHTVLFCGDLKVFKNANYRASEGANVSDFLMNEKINGELPTTVNQSKRKYSNNLECEVVSGVLKCSRKELNLQITLNSGQTYRFKEIGKDIWRGVFAGIVWTLNQFDDYIAFSAHFTYTNRLHKKIKLSSHCSEDYSKTCEQLLYDYFRLDVPLSEYYERWSASDKHFKDLSNKFCGLRMIKQEIVENLFAFICSSCTTLDRISFMVESMCSLYGEKIVEVDNVKYYDFPSIDKLAEKPVENELAKYNFGYRAKYVQQAAEYILKQGSSTWVEKLKVMNYKDARNTLMQLPGVAAKVADCICLTALDHLETIPVDTHVFQIAKLYYLPHLKPLKSVTPKAYSEIGKHLRSIFGHYSGWAHTVLFCAHLRKHKTLHS